MTETATAVRTYQGAATAFDRVARHVTEADLGAPTPCVEWDVRALLNHVVAEDLWAPPLLAGRSVEEIGSEIPEDALGADPTAAWDAAYRAGVAASEDPGLDGRTIRLTGRDATAAQYLLEMAADHLIHAWDLAAALGSKAEIPEELVATIASWFAPQEEMWRGVGVIGARVDVDPDADALTQLLAGFGRSVAWSPQA